MKRVGDECITYGYAYTAKRAEERQRRCRYRPKIINIKDFFDDNPLLIKDRKEDDNDIKNNDIHNNIDNLKIQYKKISKLIAFNLGVLSNLKDKNLLTEEGKKQYAELVKDYIHKNEKFIETEDDPLIMNAYERSLHRDFLSKMY